MTQRSVPFSIEAEESLLGNIIMYNDPMQEAVEAGLVSGDFYLDKHRKIFSIMYSMYEHKENIDSTSLASRLRDYDYLEKAGGYDYILHLLSTTISRYHTKEYIRIIRKYSLARQLITAGDKIAEMGTDTETEIGDVLDKAEKTLLDVTRSRTVSDFKKGSELFDRTLAKIQSIQEKGDTVTGLRSFYSDLDAKTTGFQRGDLIILAARPSMGKTALALNFALNAAPVAMGAIAIFSLEMPAEQLTTRMLSAKSRVPSQKLQTGKLDDNDWSNLNSAAQELKRQKFYIDDTSGIKVSEMFAKCRKLKNEEDLSLVVVDYIQLIQGTGDSESRQQEVSEISRRLKALARELDVPVIALSQLSRSVEKREDKRPMLSDLRESGALEQDADLVMFIYREEYYKRNEAENNAPAQSREDVELSLAKHRNGPTGTIKLAFEREIGCFYGIQNNGGY